jgi:hypothetical protein
MDKTPSRPFGVDYFWLENGARREGRSVATGTTEAEARANFQRQHPHVTVIHPRPQ